MQREAVIGLIRTTKRYDSLWGFAKTLLASLQFIFLQLPNRISSELEVIGFKDNWLFPILFNFTSPREIPKVLQKWFSFFYVSGIQTPKDLAE